MTKAATKTQPPVSISEAHVDRILDRCFKSIEAHAGDSSKLFFPNGIELIRIAAKGSLILKLRTSSKNSVPMTKKVKNKLKAYLSTHIHELLFVNRRGRPYSRNKIVQKVLHPALNALGIEHKGKRVGLHAFRHYVASMLLEETGPAVAQRQLRHSDPRTTLAAYGHVIGDDQKKAMETISMRRKLQRKKSQSVPIGTPAISKTSIAL